MPFTTLRLIEPLLRAVRSEGYTIPTDIQKQAIPHVLEGKDLLGCAQTGTGKTAAFALPILQRLYLHDHASPPPAHGHGAHEPRATHETHGAHAAHDAHGAQVPAAAHAAHGAHGAHGAHETRGRPAHRVIRVLVVTPTRELAAQIDESFRVYGQNTGLRHTVIYGGVSQGPQAQALRSGVDILVATPGRLLDLIGQRLLTLGHVEVFVLDEADRMLDMGFIIDIRRIIRLLPPERQNLMFSATMPREIQSLADSILRDPVEVRIAPESLAADTVQQALYYVDSATKGALLAHLLTDPAITRALVFTRTKHGADKVARRLHYAGVSVEAIHSNKSQNARMRALDNFKRGKTRVLIASDIASRGLDVDNISHVINYDLPMEAHTYVHRIGRTGRAGAAGQAISFCCDEQDRELRDIERLLGTQIPVLHHGLKSLAGDPRAEREARQPGGYGHGKRGGGRGGASAAIPITLSFKTETPEQKKEAFWKMRRKPRPLGFGRRR